MPWQVGDKPVNLPTGRVGDAAQAITPLQPMRGVDMSPRYFCYLFNITRYVQLVPKGSRSYMLGATDDQSPAIEVDNVAPNGETRIVQYKIGAQIPSTVMDTYIDTEGKRRIETQDGEEVARDCLFPAIGPACDNNDLRKWGCGYFKRLPGQAPIPTADEVRPIIEMYDENMRAWYADAKQLATGGNLSQINPIHRRAATHFKAKETWNQVIQAPVNCPNCATEIPPGVSFHTLPGTSLLCIIGQEGWRKVVAAGVKTRADVPEEYRWWDEETPAPAPVEVASDAKKPAAKRSSR